MAHKRFQETQKNWVIPFITTTTTLIALGAIFFGIFTLKPRDVECITTENTYCRQDIVEALTELKKVRFFFPGSSLRQKEKELTTLFPDLAGVAIRRIPKITLHTSITLAKPLMSVTLNGEFVVIRENGYISASTPKDGQLEIELIATRSGQQLTSPWGRQEQMNLAQLVEELEHFYPRMRKILATEPTKITAFPEGNGPIYLRVDNQSNISAQLSTLQAFFRSTTMETPYQELDVRFTHLIIKE